MVEEINFLRLSILWNNNSHQFLNISTKILSFMEVKLSKLKARRYDLVF